MKISAFTLPFWNILRQMERNNSEDLIAIKDDKGNRLFSEEEIKVIHKKRQSRLQQAMDKFHK